MTKRTIIIGIACALSVIAFLVAIYFVIGSRVSTTTVKNTNNYTNKQFGFSLTYPANQDTVEEVPQGVIFWIGDKSQNMADSSVYTNTTKGFNPNLTDPSQMVTILNNDQNNNADYKQVIDKVIVIDGYPAVVTSLRDMVKGTPVNQEKDTFFIKDKLLYTITTYKEDDALWSSFKFIK